MRALISIFLVLIWLPAAAQFNPQYNSYMLDGLVINPAYTGTRECLSMVGLHSSQWVGFEGAPMSDFLSIHTPLNNRHAIGINILNDRIGVRNMTSILPSYAYHLKISNTKKLAFGVNAGVNFFNIRNSDVKTFTQDDAFQDNTNTRSLPNIGAGLYYYTKKFYLGLSAPTLFSNDFTNVATKSSAFQMQSKEMVMILSTGGTVDITEDFVWKPSLLFKSILAGVYQVDLNSTFYYKERVSLGASYRHKDAIVGLIGYRFNSQFDIGYSYSFPLSSIIRVSSGSHELIIRYELRKKVDTFNPRYF
jgi:type IX secretion system PorP/SprF family membrane protein|tara:strand:+ start:2814 stop:3728 length:915 start_codon:yes stop_codon:yes gene_type:complete